MTSDGSLSGLVEGSSVSLACVADANPPASVIWYRLVIFIDSTARFKFPYSCPVYTYTRKR